MAALVLSCELKPAPPPLILFVILNLWACQFASSASSFAVQQFKDTLALIRPKMVDTSLNSIC